VRHLSFLLLTATAVAQFVPGPARTIVPAPGRHVDLMHATLAPDGNVGIVAWTERAANTDSEPHFLLFDRHSNVIAGPTATPWTTAGTWAHATALDVAATSSGFMIAWTRRVGAATGFRVHPEYVCVDRAGTVTASGAVNASPAVTDAYYLSCTGYADTFAVVWSTRPSGGAAGLSQGVYVRRFTSTGVPIDAVELRADTAVGGSQEWIRVSGWPSGRFVVGWSDEADGDRKGCVARFFDASGVPLGGQVAVNTLTAGDQYVRDIGTDARSRCTFLMSGCTLGNGPFPIPVPTCRTEVDVRRFDHDGNAIDPVEVRFSLGGVDNQARELHVTPTGEMSLLNQLNDPTVLQSIEPWSSAPQLVQFDVRTIVSPGNNGGSSLGGDAFGNLVWTQKVYDPMTQTYPATFQRLERSTLSVVGTVAPGSTFHLRLDSPADAGAPFVVALSAGDAVVPFDSRWFRLTPDGLFAASLSPFGIAGIAGGLRGTLDAFGTSTLATIHVPPLPALSGLVFHAGGFTLDTSGYFAPTAVRTITDSVRIVVQ
jgi:hypothetical protein